MVPLVGVEATICQALRQAACAFFSTAEPDRRRRLLDQRLRRSAEDSAWDGCTTDWVRLVNTLVNRQLHGLCLGGRHGGRQGLQVPGLGHCVAGFRNSGTENDLGELGQG